MYVLIDVEWVENQRNDRSISQMAMTRVGENWEVLDTFYSRIAPKDYTFRIWNHVGYTGGSIDDFRLAPYGYEVFPKVRQWLKPDDVLCWWYGNAKDWFTGLVYGLGNKHIVLSNYISTYLDGRAEGRGNAYRIGENFGIPAPGKQHYAKADVEMMRLVLQKIEFPQPIPPIGVFCEKASRAGALQMTYIAHLDTNTIHKRDCEHLPPSGQLKGYNDLKKPIGKGYRPCQCLKQEYLAARRERNQDIIDRTEYGYLYSPDSQVFHRRDCKVMLSAVNIQGSIYYHSCTSTGRRPCKICNPTFLDATFQYMHYKKNAPKKPKPHSSKPHVEQLPQEERRAINRYNQAIMERRAVENNTYLSNAEKEDRYTLTTSSYAFFAAKGYRNFHLRNCKKLPSIPNLEGFSLFEDASKAGYTPCKCCRPSSKHDIRVSLPIYTKKRDNETADQLKALCEKHKFLYSEDNGLHRIETSVGIWRLNDTKSPYRLEHINLIKTPGNQTNFHKQPRLFLSLVDAFYYIKRHDEGLNFTWKGSEYLPIEVAL